MKLGHEERVCEFCGGPYITRRKSRRKTCSRGCSNHLIVAKRRVNYVNRLIAGKALAGRG